MFTRATILWTAIFACSGAIGSLADEEKLPDSFDELTVKEVMRYSMTQGLCRKVIGKKADAAEQERLVKLFERLATTKPPQGSEESWNEKTKALLDAAQEVAAGNPSHNALKQAANCAACHKEHRPK